MRWPSVRKGEIRNIFPFEENAEVVFNSSTLYDIPLLKKYASPLLEAIGKDSPAYAQARGLLEFFSKIRPLTDTEISAIPATSIMREFIGGQMFK